MASLINLQTVQNPKGKLTVLERLLPDEIKRVFYINNPTEETRGRHRDKKSTYALACLVGGCKIYVNDSKTERIYELDSPEKCLILAPNDWREMYDFKDGTILLCVSNQYYDPNDYIIETTCKTEVLSLIANPN